MTRSIFPRFLVALLVTFITIRCAPRISGGFGSVRAPKSGQVAQIDLKSGEGILARKIQAEGDSLFLTLLDYSPIAIAENEIESIEVRSMTREEQNVKAGRPLSEREKSEMLRAGIGCAAAWHNFGR
jgi:hypothetical protein